MPFRFRVVSPLLLTACFLARAASASQDYPSVIADALMVRTPECTLCHADLKGGTGTVVEPFGVSMQAFQARGQDPDSLRRALDQDKVALCDSDGDGKPDLDELVAGTDPNDGPGGTCGGIPPERGCSMSSQHRQALSTDSGRNRDAWAVFLFLAMAAGSRRFTRTRMRRAPTVKRAAA